ncbi:MAG: GNAT family N-acetyltransferase, partial [Treponema sp.]|nr:GNAT family N-acetyltransferase [Treponema sp.]
MKKMEIKRLSLADKELIKEFFVNIFTKAPWYDDWSDKQQLDLYIIDLIGNVNSLTLGFFNNDELMALSMGYVKHWFRGTEYIINELCVKTEAQGKGIGSDFLHQMEEYLLAQGIEATFLLTERTVPAYNFYKKNGYYEYPDTVAFSKGFGPKYE